ncbi:DUF1573 domain-containing protein [Luteolibacter pohnpeiensis]|uniref:DUF1573 domain-containing protein n=1 Tax=Luteolibacter pohnpeiensis TaxID=454153 RepID=A0A934VV24_9BACT|nr:DUF1573 domain-containing protein [Luteolibacter pohnpeiensis]MBK1881104.1 DUF1573 domain-containing protein [Luteolibacter pohnpeiensis]
MKVVIGSWLFLAGTLFAGGLKFTETSKEITADPAARSVTAEFDFTNDTQHPVTIEKTDGGCSCVSVKVSDGKTQFSPGESGKIQAVFDIGNFSGEVDKPVKVWLKGEDVDVATQTLKIHINIPVLISMEPKTLKWTVGDKTSSKTIKIAVHDDKPVHLDAVKSSTNAFTTNLKTIKDGEEYELEVTPVSTEKMGTLGIFRIETDCPMDRYKLLQAFAVIQKKS